MKKTQNKVCNKSTEVVYMYTIDIQLVRKIIGMINHTYRMINHTYIGMIFQT